MKRFVDLSHPRAIQRARHATKTALIESENLFAEYGAVQWESALRACKRDMKRVLPASGLGGDDSDDGGRTGPVTYVVLNDEDWPVARLLRSSGSWQL